MPLKTYRKATPAFAALDNYNYADYLYIAPNIDEITANPPNMWSLLAGFYRGLKSLVATSSTAGLLIPSLFIIGGLIVIYQQFLPGITDQVKAATGYYDQGTTALVSDHYISERQKYISNPGSDYFMGIQNALAKSKFSLDTTAANFAGTMYLTIPALKFNRLPIKANVESSDKAAYDKVLTSALAHFKGTSLPFNSTAGNTVIYGHSAGGSYNPSPDDVLAAFSFLSDLKAGDIIIVEANGISHTYRMSKSRIVKPEDVTVLDNQNGKDTLTMITCYPPGNNSQRYVATATKVN